MTDHDPLAHAWWQDWHTHARAEAAPVSGGYNASLPAAGITTAPRQETHTMPARLAALLGATVAVVLSATITGAVLIGCAAFLHWLWTVAL